MNPVEFIITVCKTNTVTEARETFSQNNLKLAPVVHFDTGKFLCSLKLNDLVKASHAGRSKDKLRGMIRPSAKTVLADT